MQIAGYSGQVSGLKEKNLIMTKTIIFMNLVVHCISNGLKHTK